MPSRSFFGMFSNFPGSIYPNQTDFTTDLPSDELEQEPQSTGMLVSYRYKNREIDSLAGIFPGASVFL